jgi:heme-degrading monooxygenase HmoA
MFVRIWEFHSRDSKDEEFRAAYGPDGAWAVLFRRAAGYLGTELLVSAADARRYVTIDRWTSASAWQAFRRDWSDDYAALDRACASLTLHETDLGEFDEDR